MSTKSSNQDQELVLPTLYLQYAVLAVLGVCVIIAFIVFAKGGDLIPVIGSFY
ncbi:MAG: hypothetical protein AAGG75_06635 [Bacteroidota bacterium]